MLSSQLHCYQATLLMFPQQLIGVNGWGGQPFVNPNVVAQPRAQLFTNTGPVLVPVTQLRIQRCRVLGCTETHTQHTCRCCWDTNSDHFTSNCPRQQVFRGPAPTRQHQQVFRAPTPIQQLIAQLQQTGQLVPAGVAPPHNRRQATQQVFCNTCGSHTPHTAQVAQNGQIVAWRCSRH